MDPEVQKLMAALGQLAAQTQNSRSAVGALGTGMARLRLEMQRGTGTIQQNTQELRKLMSDFDGLDAAARRSTAGQAMLAEQTKMASEIMKNAAGSLSGALVKGGITEAVDYFKQQFFTSIKSFQDGISGTEAVFRSQNSALESQIKVLDRLSQGATVAADTLAAIPNPAARFGAAIAAGVAGLAGFASSLSGDTLKGLQFLQTEISQSTIAYQSQTKAGMVFTNGITDMRKGQADLRLNTAELTKTIVHNREQLTEFGGSVTGGYVRLRSVGAAFNRLEKDGLNLREQLYRVGYSYEEQVDGVADYMTLLKQSGQLSQKTSADIAKESTAYLINLKAISAFTGEDVKNAQKRSREASEQLAVQAKLRQSQDPKAFEKFTSAVAVMPASMQKGIQQMVAFDGTIVDKNLNQLFSVSPTRRKVLEDTYKDLQNSSLTSEQINERYQQRVKDLGAQMEKEALAAGESIGAANLATGGLGELTAGLQETADLGRKGQSAQQAQIEAIGATTVQFQRLAKEGTDPLLESVVKLDTTFRNRSAEFTTETTKALKSYMTQGAPQKGVPTMLQQQEKQFQDTLVGLKGLGVLAEIPPAFKIAREETSRMVEGMGGVVNALRETAGTLVEGARALGRVATELARMPFRETGSIGKTGKLVEDFGSGTLAMLHGKEGVITESQLKEIIGKSSTLGAGKSGDPMQAMSAIAASLSASFKDISVKDTKQLSDQLSGMQKDNEKNLKAENKETPLSGVTKLADSLGTTFKEMFSSDRKQITEQLTLLNNNQKATNVDPKFEIQSVNMPVPESLNDLSMQMKDSFVQAMASIQQQKNKSESNIPVNTTDDIATTMVETLKETFNGQNGFGQAINNLKTQVENNSEKNISMLQTQSEKLESLISIMRDNTEYARRMANELA